MSPRSQASPSWLQPSPPSHVASTRMPQAQHAGTPSLAPWSCCRDSAGAPYGSTGARGRSRQGWAGRLQQRASSGSGAGSTHALAQTPRGRRMDLTGKLGSQLGPGRAPWSSWPSSGAPAGLPSHPTHANKIRHKHCDSTLPSQLSPPCPHKLFKSSIRKCKKCTRKLNPRPSRSGDSGGLRRLKHT